MRIGQLLVPALRASVRGAQVRLLRQPAAGGARGDCAQRSGDLAGCGCASEPAAFTRVPPRGPRYRSSCELGRGRTRAVIQEAGPGPLGLAADRAPEGRLARAVGGRVRAPFLGPHQPRFHQVQAVEEPSHLLAAAEPRLQVRPSGSRCPGRCRASAGPAGPRPRARWRGSCRAARRP